MTYEFKIKEKGKDWENTKVFDTAFDFSWENAVEYAKKLSSDYHAEVRVNLLGSYQGFYFKVSKESTL